MTAIEVKDLKKSYKEVEVLKGVSFSVEEGTIFALLGANGAGKTTTINIMTTLLHADSGAATINGFDSETEAGEVRKSVSLTGQFAAVDEVLTARENLVLIGDLRHVGNPESTAQDLLNSFGLADAADRRAATFSGGMSRKLDIAMSLIGDPAVVFFDEPTTGLDPESRNMMWQTIRQLAASGTTIFLTTQYLEEADQLADRIAILAEGRIAAEGTPKELTRLLPNGRIEFQFQDLEQLGRAVGLLKGYDLSQDDDAYSLSIATDGSTTQIAQLFNEIETHQIELVDFSYKQPTLDDVFLKIVSENREATRP